MNEHGLVVRDLTVSYNRVPALHHLSFEVGCGRCVALMGPNGAGKSTLLKALAGLLRRETGNVRFHGREVRGVPEDFAYLPQRENVDWDFPATVRGLVEMGRYVRVGWWRRFGREDERAVQNAMVAMELEGLEERQISALSGGQQQRAFLARSLAQEAHVFLLDEPFSGLDQPSQDKLRGMLRQLREAGKLVMVSHHDLATVEELFDDVLFLNGELIAWGPVREVFKPEWIERTYSRRAFSGPEEGHRHG
jgi:ABC-type Mn2+/Zn2+ transport system ATPase subunit